MMYDASENIIIVVPKVVRVGVVVAEEVLGYGEVLKEGFQTKASTTSNHNNHTYKS